MVRPPRRPRRGRRALKIALLAVLLGRRRPALHVRRRLRGRGAHAALPRTGRPHRVAADHQDLRRLRHARAPGRAARPREPRRPRRRRDPPGHARRHRRRRGSRASTSTRAWTSSPSCERPGPTSGTGRSPQGGSTITQQLIKNAFVTDEQSAADATCEPALAYELESRWSKEKILNEYLNVVYFGSAPTASRRRPASYFGVDAKDLTLAQAALLAGLPEAPVRLLPPARPRGGPRPARPGAQQDVPAALHHQRATPGSARGAAAPGRRRVRQRRRQRALLGGAGAGATGRPVRLVHRAGRRAARLHEPGPRSCSRRPRRRWTTHCPGRLRAGESDAASAVRRPGGHRRPHRPAGRHGGRLPISPACSSTWPPRAAGRPARRSSPSSLVTALEQGISPETTYDSGPTTWPASGACRHLCRRRAADPGSGAAAPRTASSPG